MPSISLLVKPASSLCNLRCRYCFYHEEAKQRETPSYGVMTGDDRRKMLDRVFEAATGRVTIAFQGGEPTMAGLEWFESCVREAEERNAAKLPVSWAIQTNGIRTAEDPRWAEFFAKRHFLVGLSVDGTREIHDRFRVTPGGEGTYLTVCRAARILKKAGADFNILTVVNREVVRHAAKIYSTYRSNGWDYLQFIPCIGADAPESGEYGDFLLTLFRLWRDDLLAGRAVSIRLFDNLLSRYAGYPTEECSMNGYCSIQFVVEGDTSVFPCDFYCTDDRKMGDLRGSSLKELFEGETAQDFVKSSASIPDVCRSCEVYPLCRGGCRRYREDDMGGGVYRYCEGYKRFLTESAQDFRRLAAYFRR